MSDWRVLIVEDDAKVASIHRRVVMSHPGFRVSAVASSSEEALGHIRRGVPIDLILLDIGLPGTDGVKLLRLLRAAGGPEVIAVTAARDPRIVQSLLKLGVVDYLVKPFTVERLRQSLLRFRDRMKTLHGARLSQHDIDLLRAGAEPRILPRGLREDTLELVRSTLGASAGRLLTAAEVAERATMARVTARRYLEYLVTIRQAECETEAGGQGRPRKLYRWRALDG